MQFLQPILRAVMRLVQLKRGEVRFVALIEESRVRLSDETTDALVNVKPLA
jgi:hypothetical protein